MAQKAETAPQQIIVLDSLNDDRFRVLSPLHVEVSVDGKYYVAQAVEIDEFGFGEDPSHAIRDLQSTVVELYFTLMLESESLGPDMKRVWTVLQSKLKLLYYDHAAEQAKLEREDEEDAALAAEALKDYGRNGLAGTTPYDEYRSERLGEQS